MRTGVCGFRPMGGALQAGTPVLSRLITVIIRCLRGFKPLLLNQISHYMPVMYFVFSTPYALTLAFSQQRVRARVQAPRAGRSPHETCHLLSVGGAHHFCEPSHPPGRFS